MVIGAVLESGEVTPPGGARMEQFEIPVKFVMRTVWTVEADSKAEAIEKIKHMSDIVDMGIETGEVVDVDVVG